MGFSVGPLSPIETSLAICVAVASIIAVLVRRRGGRFRGMPGWAGSAAGFALLLVMLARLPTWASFPVLGLLMFASIRAFYFIAPMRPADNWAILTSYAAIPLVLLAAHGSTELFLATVPVCLFLLTPLLLAAGPPGKGLLDSMGRMLLGVLFFIFCMAHLGLMVNARAGTLELFGVLVIATELAQRLLGRFRPGDGVVKNALVVFAGVLVGGGVGWLLGPGCGLVEEDGWRAGVLVALAISAGAYVWQAVAVDLDMSSSASKVGRAAVLDRSIPAVYAAPVFYHYLNYFV